MARRELSIKLQPAAEPSWADVVRLVAPPTVAATAGVPVELGGVRWGAYRAPRDAPGAMFDVEDAGEFQEWL